MSSLEECYLWSHIPYTHRVCSNVLLGWGRITIWCTQWGFNCNCIDLQGLQKPFFPSEIYLEYWICNAHHTTSRFGFDDAQIVVTRLPMVVFPIYAFLNRQCLIVLFGDPRTMCKPHWESCSQDEPLKIGPFLKWTNDSFQYHTTTKITNIENNVKGMIRKCSTKTSDTWWAGLISSTIGKWTILFLLGILKIEISAMRCCQAP